MDESVKVSFLEDMQFAGSVNGHEIIIDADKTHGGNDRGPRPKPMMLLALAGCTGMDVISILGKMKVTVDDFSVEVQADQTKEHPRYYYRMHLIYSFSGNDLPMSKIKKAVGLSQEKYCGVSALYKKVVELTSEIRVNQAS